MGKALPGTTIVIDRRSPSLLPLETRPQSDPREGEIVIYGHGVMVGYHNRPEDTAAALGEDGGLRTGDLGYLDEEGYLYVTRITMRC